MKICKTIILLSFSYRKTWSLTLREEHQLQVSENEVLREYVEPRGMNWMGNSGHYTVKNFVIYTGLRVLTHY